MLVSSSWAVSAFAFYNSSSSVSTSLFYAAGSISSTVGAVSLCTISPVIDEFISSMKSYDSGCSSSSKSVNKLPASSGCSSRSVVSRYCTASVKARKVKRAKIIFQSKIISVLTSQKRLTLCQSYIYRLEKYSSKSYHNPAHLPRF